MGQYFSRDELSSCCCDVKLVIVGSKRLEAVLTQNFGATGRGLHEKINSVDGIPEPLKKKLRRVATIRNRLVHELGYDEVEDRARFRADVREAAEELEDLARKRGASSSKCSIM